MRTSTTDKLASIYSAALAAGALVLVADGVLPAWLGGIGATALLLLCAVAWPRGAHRLAPRRSAIGPHDGAEGLLHHPASLDHRGPGYSVSYLGRAARGGPPLGTQPPGG